MMIVVPLMEYVQKWDLLVITSLNIQIVPQPQ